MKNGIDWVQRLCKWRVVFTGWQLGTRANSDPEAAAVRDHRELTMLLRAEVNAQTAILIKAGVCTAEEYAAQFEAQSEDLCREYERRFPGFKASDVGMNVNIEIARDTMRGWRP